jgi:quercetin dioxygenase-like cupin family protein
MIGGMPDSVRLHRWDEIALEKITEMVSRKTVVGEHQAIAQVYVKRGTIVPWHSHDTEQMTSVLQGALRFLVGDEDVTVREGEVLHIPPGVPHQAEALDDTFVLDVRSLNAHGERTDEPPSRDSEIQKSGSSELTE